MHTKAWRTEHMGSEGWAVFMPNPRLPRFEIMIASNMSEEHAHLIAAAPELLAFVEDIATLFKWHEGTIEYLIEAAQELVRKAKGE